MTALGNHLAIFLREHLPKERSASPHTCEAPIPEAPGRRPSSCSSSSPPNALQWRHLRLRWNRLTRTSSSPFSIISKPTAAMDPGRGTLASPRSMPSSGSLNIGSGLPRPGASHPRDPDEEDPMDEIGEALVAHLGLEEIQALLNAPDPGTAAGTRDRAMLHITFATGLLRVSELIGLRLDHVDQHHWASIPCDAQTCDGQTATRADPAALEGNGGGPKSMGLDPNGDSGT